MNRITARHRAIQAGDTLTFKHGTHNIPVSVVAITGDKITVKHVLGTRTTFDVDLGDLHPFDKVGS